MRTSVRVGATCLRRPGRCALVLSRLLTLSIRGGPDLVQMEAMLLCLGDAHDFGSDEDTDFERRYVAAELGDQSNAAECLREVARIENRLSGRRLSLRGIADRIELIA